MTASTPVYGFPYEVPSDRPGVTLSGGPSGTEADILAEEVETEIERVDSDVQSLSDRTTALENAPGWYVIHEVWISEATVFAIPTTTYQMLRVHMRGGLDGVGRVTLQVNADPTVGLHAFSWEARRFLDDTVQDSNVGNGQAWAVALWSTSAYNLAEATLFQTLGNYRIAMMGKGYRAANDNDIRSYTISSGHLNTSREISSLEVNTAGGVPLTDTHVWIEGLRP